MNPTIILNLLSTVGFTLSAYILVQRKKNVALGNSVLAPLLLSIFLYDGIVISNFLEHSGITSALDPFEDLAEIVFTLVFLFFVNNWRKERSEIRFRELFHLAPMPLVETDRNGKIIGGNAICNQKLKEFYGANLEDIPTLNTWWERAYPDHEYRQKILLRWQKALNMAHQTGVPIPSEEREITCQDGSKRTMIISTSIIGDNLLFSLTDITELKQAEKEREALHNTLLQTEKMEAIGILAGGVAHDFNNILGTIMGYAELTLEEMSASDPFRENMIQILAATQRSAELVRQLLIFSRKQHVVPSNIDINKAVASILNMLRRLIGEDIELTWIPAQTPCSVRMDPSQFDQILTNLCVNARDAIDNVGQITIQAQTVSFNDDDCQSTIDCTPGQYVHLSITDNGCGMEKKTAQHVFDPFFTTKAVGQGTGLGLATVYGIVTRSSGFITLSSTPGSGTTFNIYLPQHWIDSSDCKAQEIPSISPGRAETILLVEDEPALLKMSRRMLETLGYKVLPANTPGEAIQLAKEYDSDIQLFLTDVVMPEMNGKELIDQLLQIRPDTKFLFMSGYTAEVILHRGVSRKGDTFIQKPFSLTQIAAKIRTILDAR